MKTIQEFYIDVFDNIFSLVKEHQEFDPRIYIDLFIQGNPSTYDFGEVLLNEFKNNNYGHIIKHGGHSKYYNELHENELVKSRSNKISELDLLTKKFIYKARYWPYIISALALIV